MDSSAEKQIKLGLGVIAGRFSTAAEQLKQLQPTNVAVEQGVKVAFKELFLIHTRTAGLNISRKNETFRQQLNQQFN